MGFQQTHTLNQPTGQIRKPHIRIHQIPEDPKVMHTLRNSRVTIDDPQPDLYSSDDNYSGSKEDSDTSVSSAPHEWGDQKQRKQSQWHVFMGLPSHPDKHSPCWKMLQSSN